MAFNPPKYEELSDIEYKERYNQIMQDWQSYLEFEHVEAELDVDFFVHKRNLIEIIRRCDKRRVYMEMFHDLKDICEYKRIAIESFWIMALKPFLVVNEELIIYNCPNEAFCLYRILSVIRKAFEKKYPNTDFKYPSAKRIQDILYDFKYCSLSREAMVAFVETFADVYGVGISNIFEENNM